MIILGCDSDFEVGSPLIFIYIFWFHRPEKTVRHFFPTNVTIDVPLGTQRLRDVRTPSPLRAVGEVKCMPAPARDFDISTAAWAMPPAQLTHKSTMKLEAGFFPNSNTIFWGYILLFGTAHLVDYDYMIYTLVTSILGQGFRWRLHRLTFKKLRWCSCCDCDSCSFSPHDLMIVGDWFGAIWGCSRQHTLKTSQLEEFGAGGKLGFSLTQDTTDVIYAEDEEVFRETAVRELLKLGFLRQDFSCSREGEVGHIFGPWQAQLMSGI